MKSFAHAFCALLLATVGHAMGVALQLDHAAKVADAIVHCQILGTKEASATEVRYQRVAQARVLASAKGPAEGQTLALLFDNGLGCPNVHYAPNEEVLVFLKKTDSGAYETMHAYCGRFSVENGVAKSVYLFTALSPNAQDYPVEEALRRIRDAVAKAPVADSR